MILTSLMRLFDPTLMESGLLYVGNSIAQYFFHVEQQIIPTVLEAIVRRVYRAKMPSIVQSLVIVFARFINKFPIDTISFLTSIQVENRVGLKVLIDKWLLHQPLFRGNYFKNISIKALTMLFEMKNSLIESLMVIGYNPSHSNTSVEVNAPLKILSVLIRALHKERRQEDVKKEKTDYENLNYDDHFNEEDDEDEDEDNVNYGNEDMIQGEVEEKKLDIDLDEFKNLEDEQITTKLRFINLQGQSGGIGNIEAGSEVYMTEMLVRSNF